MKLPLVSFCLPTYNEEQRIKKCLENIFSQDYPKDKIEVIVADDGSTDKTLELCRRYPVRILHNPSGIGEVGWAMGVDAAKGEFVVLLSADNELACEDWISKMVKPVLEDGEITGVHPSLLASREDLAINRYIALLQAFPLGFYLMWGLRRPKEVIAREGYFLQVFQKDSQLAIGANGTLFRRGAVLKAGNVPPYRTGGDIDLTARLVKASFTKYAHVPEAVVYHHSCQSYSDFVRKLRRNAKSFPQYTREYPWLPSRRGELLRALKWILFCSTFIGPLIHAFCIRKKGDPAWLYHPFACFTQVVIYGLALLASREGRGLVLKMVRALARGH